MSNRYKEVIPVRNHKEWMGSSADGVHLPTVFTTYRQVHLLVLYISSWHYPKVQKKVRMQTKQSNAFTVGYTAESRI